MKTESQKTEKTEGQRKREAFNELKMDKQLLRKTQKKATKERSKGRFIKLDK